MNLSKVMGVKASISGGSRDTYLLNHNIKFIVDRLATATRPEVIVTSALLSVSTYTFT